MSADLLAELALLLASVFYALSPIYARRFGRAGHAPIVSATGQFTAAAVMMVPLALVIDRPWTLPMPGADVWAALIALAALSTAVAYIIYYRILKTAGAVNLMLVTLPGAGQRHPARRHLPARAAWRQPISPAWR